MSSAPSPAGGEARPASEAERALELVSADPRRALEVATGLLGRPGLDAEERVVAERAAALAELELGWVAKARARFERARDGALAGGVRHRLAEIRIGLAIALLHCEEPDAAMAEIDAALAVADDLATRGKVQAQRATVLMRLGRYPEALTGAAEALDTCRAAGLTGPVARLLSNRGIVHAYLGAYAEAEDELREALDLLRREGSDLGAANVVHNLGFVAARRGNVPSALAHFGMAQEEHRRLGLAAPAALTDRCEVLLSARLLPEARAAAEEAVSALEQAGQATDLAEAKLMLAEVAVASGDLATARSAAGEAAESLSRQGRPAWAVLARFVEARARWSALAPEAAPARGPATGPAATGPAHPSPRTADAAVLRVIAAEAGRLAADLDAAGWRLQALEARIAGARSALAAGDHGLASAVLGAPAGPNCAGGSTGTSADERVRGWYAEALRRLASGDRRGALQALDEGLRVAEDHRATLGATELRARSATRSGELAELGTELAIAEGEAGRVLEWAERWRARSLWPPDVLPPPDPELADRLAQLRHTVAALEVAVQAGEGSSAAAMGLRRRRRELEGAIRQRSFEASGRPRPAPAVPDIAEVQRVIAGSATAAVVELLSVRGSLQAVVCTERSCVVRPLATVEELERRRAALRFGLARLVLGRDAPSSLVAAAELAQRSARAVSELLLGPIVPDLEAASGDDRRELVFVPTGSLHGLPWSLLPNLSGRPLSVSPSLALFLRPARPSAGKGPVLLVGAPNLRSAETEVEAIAELYPGAVVLAGERATAGEVASAMGVAPTAHLVAHGRFRSDNALFSALELADGPLTVYELEQIGAAPDLLVLSSCDAGRADVQPGDELMGTAATLLSLGSRAIVASVLPVPDAGAPPVMVRLHRHLRAGRSPAAALALVQQEHAVLSFSPEELATRSPAVQAALAAAGLVCLGAGGATSPPVGRASRDRRRGRHAR